MVRYPREYVIFVYTFSTHYSYLRSLNPATPYSMHIPGIWTSPPVGSVPIGYAVRAAAYSGGPPRSAAPPHPINFF